MDKKSYKKVNQILNEHLLYDGFEFYLQLLEVYLPLVKEAYENEGYEITSTEFSRKFEIDETLDIVKGFLNTISTEYGERFENMLYQTVDGKPLINIKPISLKKPNDDNCLNLDGTLEIYYSNDPTDPKTIVHEIFHKFNELILVDENGVRNFNVYNRLYTEAVSIFAEKLLIMHMYKYGYITENDAALMLNDRMTNTMQGAYLVECENQYLRLAERGYTITEETPSIIKTCFDRGTSQYEIWETEEECKCALANIVGHGTLTYAQNLPYVIGDYYSELLLDNPNKERTLYEFNELLCNPELTASGVEKFLRKKMK